MIMYKFGVRPKTIWTIQSDPQLHNAKVQTFTSLRGNLFRLAETTIFWIILLRFVNKLKLHYDPNICIYVGYHGN